MMYWSRKLTDWPLPLCTRWLFFVLLFPSSRFLVYLASYTFLQTVLNFILSFPFYNTLGDIGWCLPPHSVMPLSKAEHIAQLSTHQKDKGVPEELAFTALYRSWGLEVEDENDHKGKGKDKGKSRRTEQVKSRRAHGHGQSPESRIQWAMETNYGAAQRPKKQVAVCGVQLAGKARAKKRKQVKISEAKDARLTRNAFLRAKPKSRG